MMGEEVFQLHVAAPTYTTCPKSLYKARQAQQLFPCWCATVSFFPAGVQKGLLSLLVCKRVFFSCWCSTGSSFPAGALQISNFKILPCQANKMATGHKTHKLVDNLTIKMIILPNMVHINSCVMKKGSGWVRQWCRGVQLILAYSWARPAYPCSR